MAAATIYNWLITWAQHDQPGAGSQNTDSTGINGNWFKIAEKFAFLFNLPQTTLREGIIDGPQLKSGVADDSTLEYDATSKKLRAKALGIQKSHINSNVVDNTSLEKRAGGEIGVKAGGIALAHLEAALAGGLQSVVFVENRAAGGTAGNVPSAKTTWNETSTSDVTKVVCHFRKRAIDNYLRLVGSAKGDIGAGGTWRVTMRASYATGKPGTSSQNDTGDNDVYDMSNPEIGISLALGSYTNDHVIKVEVQLASLTGSNVSMTDIVVVTSAA